MTPSSVSQRNLVYFLDYDGTLVPLKNTPQEATLPAETLKLLTHLAQQEKVTLVIISGRNSEFLAQQFQGVNAYLVAEHGGKYFDPRKSRWKRLVFSDQSKWYPNALKIMKDYAFRVSGSWVERKEFSIAWHYRQSPEKFGHYQARKLIEELSVGFANLPVSILDGIKVVEVRATEANKGRFVHWFLENYSFHQPSLLAIGDDQSDEDLFRSLPEGSVSIRVGEDQITSAKYTLSNQQEVLELLKKLSAFPADGTLTNPFPLSP